ncbi:BspA family leucine-rich repeat surface protein [Persicobacter psychrovividus]
MRFLFLLLGLLGVQVFASQQAHADEERPFIITVDIPDDSKDFYVLIRGGVNDSGASDYTIDWGDGNTTTGGSSSEEQVSHTYAEAGEYQVSMSGKLPSVTFSTFNNNPNQTQKDNASKVSEVVQWGSNQWYSTEYMFAEASAITDMPEESPNLSFVSSMQGMFYRAVNFNGNLSSWDVSNVQDMSYLFAIAASFNGDLSSWDVGNVATIDFMFQHARAFNGNLSAWDVSNVRYMRYVFSGALIFSGDLSTWDISNVYLMDDLLRYPNFNRDLYEKILKNWSQLDVRSGLRLELSTTYCSPEAVEGRRILIEKGWVISDNGRNCSGVVETAPQLPEGEGTSENPYVISNLAELRWLSEGIEEGTSAADRWQGEHNHYLLSADIDAFECKEWNEGKGFLPIGREGLSFTGVFDGQNFKISYLRLDDRYGINYGLFGEIEDATVKNLAVDHYEVYADKKVGLIASAIRSEIENVHVQGRYLAKETLGGVVGYLGDGSNISLCAATVEMIGVPKKVGGVVGEAVDGGTIRLCQSAGTIPGYNYIGGLVGWLKNTKLENGHSSVQIESKYPGDHIDQIGGLAGFVEDAQISNAYAIGLLIPNYGQVLSGAIGEVTNSNVAGVFWDKQTTGMQSDGSEHSVGLLTADFEDQSNFTNWDFEGVWAMGKTSEGLIRPFFQKDVNQVKVSINGNGKVTGDAFYAFDSVDLSFVIQPNQNYVLESCEVDGHIVDVKDNMKLEFANIQEDINVNVSFTLKTYELTASVADGPIGEKGATITPESTIVTHGDEASFTLTFDPGYELDYWKVDGQIQEETSNTLTLSNVTKAQTVEAKAKIIEYPMTLLPLENGVISASTTSVPHGTSVNFTLEPVEGYELDEWTIDNVVVDEPSNVLTILSVTQAHRVSATVKLKTYPISASVSEPDQASINPTTVTLEHGASQDFELTIETGYELDGWYINDELQSETSSTLRITAFDAMNIEAKVKPIAYNITASAGINATISPEEIMVGYGATQRFTVTPREDYEVIRWTVDDVTQEGAAGNTFDLLVSGEHHVHATTQQKKYKVNASVNNDAGGSLSYRDDELIHGQDFEISVSLNEGYEVNQWVVNGVVENTKETNKLIQGVKEDLVIEVVLELIKYPITVVQVEGAAISPATIEVAHGMDQTFELSLEDGYSVDYWTVDGESVKVNSLVYTLRDIKSEHQVSALLTRKAYEVTASVNEGATISPETVSVFHGENQTFTLEIEAGYQLKHWMVNDMIQTETSNTFVLKDVQENNLHVEAVVEPVVYTLTVVQVENGSISPETTTVSYGEDQTFTISTDKYHLIEDVLVDGESVGAVETYTFEAVEADHEITAIFTRILSNDQQAGIRVYPNPVRENLHFEGLSKQATVQFVDAMGRIVLKTVVAPNTPTVDVSPLGTGLYQVMLDGQVVEKLLKE